MQISTTARQKYMFVEYLFILLYPQRINLDTKWLHFFNVLESAKWVEISF